MVSWNMLAGTCFYSSIHQTHWAPVNVISRQTGKPLPHKTPFWSRCNQMSRVEARFIALMESIFSLRGQDSVSFNNKDLWEKAMGSCWWCSCLTRSVFTALLIHTRFHLLTPTADGWKQNVSLLRFNLSLHGAFVMCVNILWPLCPLDDRAVKRPRLLSEAFRSFLMSGLDNSPLRLTSVCCHTLPCWSVIASCVVVASGH